jgi:uncharacterized protein YjbI with pentapeptide repeats
MHVSFEKLFVWCLSSAMLVSLFHTTTFAACTDPPSAGVDWSHCDKSGADLSGVDLSGAYLSNADLSGADLTGACLDFAFLTVADLRGAKLAGADLSLANLSGANLTGSNLAGANLFIADLSGADLSDADLRGADLFGANLTAANLSRAQLTGVVELTDVQLRSARSLLQVKLSHLDLRGFDLHGLNLSGAGLGGAILTDANLTGANLAGADLLGAMMSIGNIRFPGSLTVLPPSLQAGPLPVGAVGQPQQIVLTNLAADSVVLTGIPTAAGDFSISHDCPAMLDFGAQCLVSAVFSSTAPGVHTATLTISSSAGDRSVALIGSGILATGNMADLGESAAMPEVTANINLTSTILP